MNPVSVGLNGLLALLLLAALIVGVRLNTKLKGLKAGQQGFIQAVAALDAAAARAESGLADLRAATQDAHDTLLSRIETARTLSARLDRACEDADTAVAKADAAARRAERIPVAAAQSPAPAPARPRLVESGPAPEGAEAMLRLIEAAREEAGAFAPGRVSHSVQGERLGALAPAMVAPAVFAPDDAASAAQTLAPPADRLSRFVARRREARAG